MAVLRILFLLAGLVLLGFVIRDVDFGQVGAQVVALGGNLFWVLAIVFLAFLIDTASWQIVLRPARLDVSWLYRLWKIRMVGSAFNQIIPLVGKGGEPIKAIMLKRLCDVGYREGAASLIATETINLLALVLFVATALVVAAYGGVLPPNLHAPTGAGIAVFGLAIGAFFLIQRFRIASLAGHWLSRAPFGRSIGAVLAHIRDVDDRLAGFYAQDTTRFAVAFALALLHWAVGALEIMLTAYFLGNSLTLLEAWSIAAVVELVRAGTFFIPASIGAQEGALVVVTGAITGQPTLGLSLALVRRFRELLWILWGLGIGWRHALVPVFRSPRSTPVESP
ncbi:MAG: flippase-like domain-containing protein [Rhodospirillales bacterium]|nr:flippase-like domain-containing protein [Rhodospirillales bacterium]